MCTESLTLDRHICVHVFLYHMWAHSCRMTCFQTTQNLNRKHIYNKRCIIRKRLVHSRRICINMTWRYLSARVQDLCNWIRFAVLTKFLCLLWVLRFEIPPLFQCLLVHYLWPCSRISGTLVRTQYIEKDVFKTKKLAPNRTLIYTSPGRNIGLDQIAQLYIR